MSPKEYRKYAFRSHAAQIADWRSAAKKRHVSLARFIREAADNHRASMTDVELNQQLLAMRAAINRVLQLRTAEQKNARLTAVRDHLTSMIHRKPNQFWR